MGSSLSQTTAAKEDTRVIIPNHTVEHDIGSKFHPNSQYKTNLIRTTKYSLLTFLPKNLYEQFHRSANIYFVFIVILNWVPQVNAFGKELSMLPIAFVLSVTAIKDAFEDYRRFRSDRLINNKTVMVFSRSAGSYVELEWRSLAVGDIVCLSCNDVIPADMILLHSDDPTGVCYIDTANIDGENNLKQREAAELGRSFKPEFFTYTIECEKPSLEIYKFSGSIRCSEDSRKAINQQNLLLRGCVLRNTETIQGIILYAGHDTKAMMNNRGPRYKRSQLEHQINRDVVWCVILLFIMCVGCAVGSGLFLKGYEDITRVPFLSFSEDADVSPGYQAFVKFWTFIIIFQVMIPLPLYVTIELIKLGQVYFITNDLDLYDEATDTLVECKALNITEDLGQVDIIFSDKTGTLTENKMTFKKCSIGGIDYSGAEGLSNPSAEQRSLILPSSTQDDFDMDERLQQLLSGLCLSDAAESHHIQTVWDFFLLLTVCNTVVVSADTTPNDLESLELSQDEVFKDRHREVSTLLSSVPHTNITSGKLAQRPESMDSGISSLDVSLVPGTSSCSDISTATQIPDRTSIHKQGHTNQHKASSFNTQTNWSQLSVLSDQSLKNRYEAESPDELALVKAACSYGCQLLGRTHNQCHIGIPGDGEVRVQILHVLHFDSTRKRMSVIIEHPHTKQKILLCKGADAAILPNLSQDSFVSGDDKLTSTQDHLMDFSMAGLRTLCMAKRTLTEEVYNKWQSEQVKAENALVDREQLLLESACDIERDMTLLGATGIEDQLQEGVPDTIAALRMAGIAVWVLTGDKQETALNIAYSCQLIDSNQQVWNLCAKDKESTAQIMTDILQHIKMDGTLSETPSPNHGTTNQQGESNTRETLLNVALVINGETLSFILGSELEQEFLRLLPQCQSVLCCRVTPFQKAQVVKLVQCRLEKLTLAIGDGANDVNMIQTADIGVGISGQEGMQAVMASDFSLARFHFLKKLLLVHGHWSYDKLARMTLYMWYKNAVFIFMLLWYQIYSGFSAGTMLDDFNLILFNLVYTSIPPIILGVLDQDTAAEILIANPRLYQQGPRREVYASHSYFLCILDAMWQSIVLFFVPYWVYSDSSAGLWEFGATCMTGSVLVALLHLCLETKSLNVFQLASLVLSAFLFYCCNFFLAGICTGCSPPANPYWVCVKAYSSPLHWLSVWLVIILALLPRFVVRSLQGSFHTKPVASNYHSEVNPPAPEVYADFNAQHCNTTSPSVQETQTSPVSTSC